MTRRSATAHRAIAKATKRVDGRLVACQLASLGPPREKSDKVPPSASHDELRRFVCVFGKIEARTLGAVQATGQFRGYAVFIYKSAEGLTKALAEPGKVFDGCELYCQFSLRRGRVNFCHGEAAASRVKFLRMRRISATEKQQPRNGFVCNSIPT